jgi:hypothetical protein
MVRYVESCGRVSVPTVAWCLGRHRLPVSLLCGRSERRRFIPKPDIAGSDVDELASSTEDVRIWSCFDRRQGGPMGIRPFMLADQPSVLAAVPWKWIISRCRE